MIGSDPIHARNAVEALRAGVPNRTAIRALGSAEDELTSEFVARLRLCGPALDTGAQVEGIGIVGAFGAGKSHQLGYLAELALRENFIVSLVPISKETPLFDPGRLFAAAVRTAIVPGENDDLLTAAMRRLRPNSDAYDAFEARVTADTENGLLAPLFPALLHVIPRVKDPDDHHRMVRFLAGGKLNVSVVRGWLRTAGAAKLFDLKSVREAELALQRLRFAPYLLRAAGFAGWCILLDEIELIGKYSPLQRGRSYAELARWLGLERDPSLPGVVCVAAVTDDFKDEMFDRKRDDELIPPRLEQRGLVAQVELAKKGMAWLARPQFRLSPPHEGRLRFTLDQIANLYADAYGWTPPPTEIGERLTGKSMRQYIKSWITTWDIERLYGETPHIAAGTIATDYDENTDMEHATASDSDDAES